MYRRYEDPYKVKRLLDEAKTELENARITNPDDEDLLIGLYEDVAELEERLNFAWQDDEAEIEGYDY